MTVWSNGKNDSLEQVFWEAVQNRFRVGEHGDSLEAVFADLAAAVEQNFERKVTA